MMTAPADYIGLHPRPYILYEERPSTRKEDGMNFAVGGSGVKDNLGFTKTRDQIAQLKTVINSGVYSETVYKESLILFTISGNDYYAFLRNSQVIGLAVISHSIYSCKSVVYLVVVFLNPRVKVS